MPTKFIAGKRTAYFMRGAFLLVLLTLLSSHLAAGTIQYEVVSLGGDKFRYVYHVSDIPLLANQEIDFKFDPALYTELANPTVGSDFTATLLQPNNPSGTWGDFGALASVDNPSYVTPFTVEVRYLGAGTPGAQIFYINQFTATGGFVGTIGDAGSTTTSLPEPATFGLGFAGIAVGLLWRRLHPK